MRDKKCLEYFIMILSFFTGVVISYSFLNQIKDLYHIDRYMFVLLIIILGVFKISVEKKTFLSKYSKVIAIFTFFYVGFLLVFTFV